MQRRDFLKFSALATGASLTSQPGSAWSPWDPLNIIPTDYERLVPEIFSDVSPPPSYTPAIVIGSGFGGAISAYRLAKAGIVTTVLERGSRWPVHPWREIHPNDFTPDGRNYWHRNEATLLYGLNYKLDKFGGLLDTTDYDNISVWRGACVGGGSKVFTGVMIEPQKQYFQEVFGDTVNYDEMHNIYYPRVRKMLRLSTMPDSLYNSPAFGHSRIWDEQVRKAGYQPELIDGIWNWDIVKSEYHWFKRRSALNGESNSGNSNGAKFDLTQNYLKYAENTGNAHIYPGMQVTDIGRDEQGRYLVKVEQINPYGEIIDAYTLSCHKLILAAGSIGTSELLVKAREKGYLPDLNEYIGTGWGTNGDAAVARSFSSLRGFTQASPSRSKIETVAPSGMPVTNENWYALHAPVNIGVVGSLGMTLDMTNRANFRYLPETDTVTLDWAKEGNDDSVAALKEINEKIADANNIDTGVFNGIQNGVSASFTAHPLGGAILGKATDNYGRVKGYDGLYVMDGAMINGNTGAVNPSLTISALAERNIEHIITNDL